MRRLAGAATTILLACGGGATPKPPPIDGVFFCDREIPRDEKVVRLLPPLNIEVADIDRGVDILDTVLAAVETEVPA